MNNRSRQFSLRSIIPVGVLPLLLAGTLATGACSNASGPSPTAAKAPTTSAAPAASPVAANPVASSPVSSGASPAAVSKVNANSASQDEIAQALGAAGVVNSARWAREVVEYRPYPSGDPSFAKLRQELAKYNPGPGIVDQIISALSL